MNKPDASIKNKFIGGTILVAEDNKTNQKVLDCMLSYWGCQFFMVSSGKEALKALATQMFDVILMDCQMPVMDGYEATNCINCKFY